MQPLLPILAELDRSLSKITIDGRDAATVALARQLAWTIDNAPDELEKLAPKLLACLSSLGLTTTSRKEVKRDGDSDPSEDAFGAVLQLVQPAG